jgi:uncharacterized protein YfiM (DUF2279 family)
LFIDETESCFGSLEVIGCHQLISVMKFKSGRTTALALATFLIAGGRLAADSSMFQLFPSTLPRNPLLTPEAEESGSGLTLMKGTALITETASAEGPRLGLPFPDQAQLSVASPVNPAAPRIKTIGVGPGWKPVLMAAVMATTVAWAADNSLDEPSSGRFQFANEGFFGRHTYNGGVDKAAHFVDYNLMQVAFANTYRRIGYTSGQSGWIGFATSLAAGLTTEIGDGTRIFGFSWEDLLMDAFGAATAMGLSKSGWNDTIGFRFGTFSQDPAPSCCADNTNIGRDYSGEIYTADLKIAGLARRLNFNPGPARFLLLSTTYGTNGYNHVAPELRQRLVGLEIGVNFSEIFRSLGVPSEPLWGEVFYYFFDSFRIPYTAIGVRYDVNNHEWFGPTAGRTRFRVPAGSR